MGKYKNCAISSFVNTQNNAVRESTEEKNSFSFKKEERRERRVHLLMKQSVYLKVKAAAEQGGTSVNHVVECLIEQYL